MGGNNFYHDEPLFGLDIGHNSVKVMQLERVHKGVPKVLGYGLAQFPAKVKMNGVITDFELLAKCLYDFFKDGLTGGISTKRVACTLPTAHSYSRLMKLPDIDRADIREAIKLEAEQYIPMPADSLYIDYEITSRLSDGIELLMVATPKSIVDSYVKFLESIDLEPVALEPSMNAITRTYGAAEAANKPSILIDIGAVSIDLAVFDKTIVVNSTLAGGSELMTKQVSQALKLEYEKAFEVKSKYGIGASEMQQKVLAAIQPTLDELVKEVRRILRYYTDRVGESSKQQIAFIVTCGGGATMPGINEYLSRQLNLPAKALEPWDNLNFGSLPKPPALFRTAYITAAGVALLNPGEVYP